MYSKVLLAALSAGLVNGVAADNATPVTGNPSDVAFTATLPDKPFFQQAAIDGNVKGSISAQAPQDGKGVKFSVKFENFPKEGGPFIYHIHVNPAQDGNCTSTGGHLDPFQRGDKPACDSSDPASCQVGDLSGKYGKITHDPFTAEFVDPFTSTTEGAPAFFGDRSFVIHYANGTRLTCANFAKAEPGPVHTSDCSESAAPTTLTTETAAPSQYTTESAQTAAPTEYTTDCGGEAPPETTSESSAVVAPSTWVPTGTGTGGLPHTTGGSSNPTTVPVTAGASTFGFASSLLAGVGLVAMMVL